MKLTLHIGLGKTGTSSLQTFLMGEHDFLMKNGIFAPGLMLGKLPKDARLPSQGAVNNAKRLKRGLRGLEKKAASLSGVKEVVWSNESLGMGFERHEIAPKIKKILEGSDVFTEFEVIIVVRRQDDWIESAYRQWALKHKVAHQRKILSPMAYKKRAQRVMDYDALYDSWCVFGPENVRLVTYDEIRAGRGIIEWFCKGYGITYQDKFDKYATKNISFGVSQSYFFSVYARGFDRPVLPAEFRDLIEKYDLPELSAPGSAFCSNKFRAKIMEDYAESNRRLAQKVFGRDDLFPKTEPRKVIPYTTGEQDALTYLAIIAKQQHDRLYGGPKLPLKPKPKPVANPGANSGAAPGAMAKANPSGKPGAKPGRTPETKQRVKPGAIPRAKAPNAVPKTKPSVLHRAKRAFLAKLG